MIPVLTTLRRRKFDTLVYLSPSVRSPEQVNRDRKFFQLAGIKNFIGMTGFAEAPEKIPGKPLSRLPWRRTSFSTGSGRMAFRCHRRDRPVPIWGWIFRRKRKWPRGSPACPPTMTVSGSEWGGTKMPAKRWPKERFREVVADLISKHAVWPVVFGGNEDIGLGNRLLSAWGCGYNAAGKTFPAWFSRGLETLRVAADQRHGTMHLGRPWMFLVSSCFPPAPRRESGNL